MAPRPFTPEALLAHVGRRVRSLVAPGKSVCVAFSGGVDSTVLLDLLARLRGEAGFALGALHVHHGLSAHADMWADACASFATQRGVSIRIERVSVDRAHPGGVEAAARAARQAAFHRAGADFVALAHHRDDQAETVLLQALRGTGLKGLSAMAEVKPAGRATWIRPLLEVPRAALVDYARARALAWIEDDSNAQSTFDRNFLRRDVMPALAARFPQAAGSLARLARHAAAAQRLMEDLAREDAQRASEGDALSTERLAELSPERQANVLRHYLCARGLAMPSQARLANMLRQLVLAKDDARVLVRHGHVALARHHRCIVVEEAGEPRVRWQVEWRGETVLELGEGLGVVRFAQATGEGIARDHVGSGTWRFAPRAGGERIRLRADGPTRTLKNLLNERGVPVWRRGRLPLLFEGGRLVWVPGVGVAADYLAPHGRAGLAPEWQPPGPKPNPYP